MLNANEYLRFMKTFQPMLSTSRLHLISFDQTTFDSIFSTCQKEEIMAIFGHQKEATIKHRYEFGDEVDTDHMYSLFPDPNYQ